ncbi:hypothetical protein BGX26_006980 [Mortierella sp. AD094]|nr:hypothetical protein BGX26_006980 [Mortierella sp. AD094]
MNSNPSSDDDSDRRLKADQESWLPGLAYAGAAAIGGSVLVNGARSMPVKVLTPLALAAATGAYFLPAHTEQFKHTWVPMRMSSKSDPSLSSSDSSNPNSTIHSLKQTVQGVTSEIGDKVRETIGGVPRVIPSTKNNNGMSNQDQASEEMAAFRESLPENPSSSRWSWWKGTDTTAPMLKEMDGSMMQAENIIKTAEKPLAAIGSSSSSSNTVNSSTSSKPHKVVVDKALASAAVKGHDALINRAALLGKNAEESALKVHENVVDAAMPKHRQGRHEKHQIEISRQASQSDLKDGKFVIRVTENSENPSALPERVRRGSMKKDMHHGLENLERRASMIYNGVEHIEHDINKRIQKALEEEAEFWHQQSLKEEARSRGGERAM